MRMLLITCFTAFLSKRKKEKKIGFSLSLSLIDAKYPPKVVSLSNKELKFSCTSSTLS